MIYAKMKQTELIMNEELLPPFLDIGVLSANTN